jgi:hypothetical protein
MRPDPPGRDVPHRRHSDDTRGVKAVSPHRPAGTVSGMDPLPNNALKAARMSLLLSQDGLARAIRQAGVRAGQPNEASKRLVQRWESGTTATPSPVYARALEQVTGLPIEALGFAMTEPLLPAGRGDDHPGPGPGSDLPAFPPPATTPQPNTAHRTYTGIWLSRYRYPSSGRGTELEGRHHVVLLQHGHHLTVRSLPDGSFNPNSPLTMDLDIDGSVVTGTWTEQTALDGYYRGARYHGAIQMLIEPTGRRMTGKWVGFGKDMDVNTGPWELLFQDASTGRATIARYNRRPDEVPGASQRPVPGA